jgi:SAM-dependent methyltransferase
MPTLAENKRTWKEYDWSRSGEEWSASFGSSEMQWFGWILPRLRPFLPAQRVLEIAPGFGRWTRFLIEHCDEFTGIDLEQRCVTACADLFPDARFFTNDGSSLAGIADRSIDLVFSFDSLVHAEQDIMRAYVREIAVKLAPQGVAFIHHSNMAAFERYFKFSHRVPRVGPRLQKLGLLDLNIHAQAWTMSDEKMRAFAKEAGLSCIAQETFPLEFVKRPIDCVSVLTRPGSKWDRPYEKYENLNYNREAKHLKRLHEVYGKR